MAQSQADRVSLWRCTGGREGAVQGRMATFLGSGRFQDNDGGLGAIAAAAGLGAPDSSREQRGWKGHRTQQGFLPPALGMKEQQPTKEQVAKIARQQSLLGMDHLGSSVKPGHSRKQRLAVATS